ncbi:Recombination protein O [Moraxella ovis]|nr:Recombination protein O [Moraxella ovis]STZ06222.1 Recombination protein O [Moraxella ovis]
MVSGVGARGMPSFVPMTLFATGKNALKSFTQIQPSPEVSLTPIMGQTQYALLYMNEVLSRLLVPESPCEVLWQVYHDEIMQLRGLGVIEACDSLSDLKQALRRFERALFDELGVSLDFECDGLGESIEADGYYRFVPEVGFVPIGSTLINKANDEGKKLSRVSYLGSDLLEMARAQSNQDLYVKHLQSFSQLQRDVMDYLLEYKPLHSRNLWRQSLQYQSV